MKKRVYQIWIAIVCFMLALSLNIFSRPVLAAAPRIYIAVERFTVGQGYVVEPCTIEITEGEKAASVFERLMAREGWEPIINRNSTYGWYLEGIKNADSGSSRVPCCIQAMGSQAPKDSDLTPAKEKNREFPNLSEFSYTNSSGWLYFVNGKSPSVGLGNWAMHDGDVMRVRFSLYGYGADLGDGMSESADRPSSLNLPNLDEEIKRIAVCNDERDLCIAKGYGTALDHAVSTISDMDNTKEQIAQACARLPSEAQIAQWRQELAAQESSQAVKAVVAQIQAIGEVTLASEGKITAARAAYTALSDTEKAQIPRETLLLLQKAERQLDQLKQAQNQADAAKAISGVKISGIEGKIYTGSALTQKIVLTDGAKTLKEGQDYSVSYKDNVHAGTASVVITGKGSYTGTRTEKFSIARRKISGLKFGKVKDQAYTGKAVKPSVIIKNGARTLKKNRDYTVSFRDNKKPGKAKIVVRGKGDYTGSKTVAFSIKKSLAKAKVAKIKNQKYTGKAIKPKVKVTCSGKALKAGRDYTVSYKNNKKKGKATVTITGKGSYMGTKKVTFRIVKR